MIELPADLWANQRAALECIFASIAAGQKFGLIVQPTGTGKTRTFVELMRILRVPALALVPRDVLVRQTVAAVGRHYPAASIGIIQAERDEWQSADLFNGRAPDVVVASVQSLHEKRLHRIPCDRFGLIVSDEAHRSVAKGWSRVVSHFQPGFHLGCTATPERLDRRGLAVHFGPDPLYVYPIHEAIGDGVLVPVRQLAIRTDVDLDTVNTLKNGQWDVADLSVKVATDERCDLIVGAYLSDMKGRRAVAFCVDCDHVKKLAAAFNAASVPAVAILGSNPEERRQQLEDFAAGKYLVAVNCEVLNEGFDDPGVSGILWARPTESRAFYMQGIGRGLRRSPETGKKDCLVIDFVDATRLHKLVTCCNLLGLRHTSDAQGQDVLALVHKEKHKREQDEANSQQQLLACPLAWRIEEVSPWPDLPSLDGYRAKRPWQMEPATERQIKALRRMGLEAKRDITRGEASWLFDRAREYEVVFPTPATPRQERFLRAAGAWKDGVSRREASRAIGAVKRAMANA